MEANRVGDTWLSLREASRLLGVSASTVRRWGDGGKLRMSRTAGGHRRFPQSALASVGLEANHWSPPWFEALGAYPRVETAGAWGVDRQQLALQEWRPRLAPPNGSALMRGLGQRLLGLLIQYLNDRTVDPRLLAEAHAVGTTYGIEARKAGGSLHDVVEAFLFFRRAFTRLALSGSGISAPMESSDPAILYSRVDHFMDSILLGTIAGYEG
ncbi:MAG TPA: helix-turn-helix domain-containing protein [Chloroflexota bacterium]|nr:helix-turn-helix domain-containing protein [Chloroflexota bacterium]